MDLNLGLAGKTIIVTGGASGIGEAAALLAGMSGCNVIVGDMNEAAGLKTVELINEGGPGRALFHHVDVAREDQVKSLVETAVSTYGKLHGAINAAGIAHTGGALHELSATDFDRVLNVNLRGMFLCIKYQIAAMLQSGGGSIVAISSSASLNGLANASDYCSAKAGVNGLIRAGAMDYADRGIRLNAILPGATNTPMMQRAVAMTPNMRDIVNALPMKRFAESAEVAAPALWLLSDHASYITGVSLPIDGALSIQ
jgi:NAD(P)-dependent dehydrogenase (short-subunit alcohol dehydrogenase family)